MIDNGTYDRVMKNMNSHENVAKREATKKERGSYYIGAAKTAKILHSRVPKWICSFYSGIDKGLQELSYDLGYSANSGPYSYWKRNGCPDFFHFKGNWYRKL